MFSNIRDRLRPHLRVSGGDPVHWRVLLLTAATLLVGACAITGRRANPLEFGQAFRCSADADAAMSVPGWTLIAGSPTLLCASALRARWPDEHAPRLVVASGPWGASMLERTIALRDASAHHR